MDSLSGWFPFLLLLEHRLGTACGMGESGLNGGKGDAGSVGSDWSSFPPGRSRSTGGVGSLLRGRLIVSSDTDSGDEGMDLGGACSSASVSAGREGRHISGLWGTSSATSGFIGQGTGIGFGTLTSQRMDWKAGASGLRLVDRLQ